jgi:hypothetical protein
MRQFSIFQIPIAAFHSRALYSEAARLWRGTGLGYLFLLLAFCTVPIVYALHLRLDAFMRENLEHLAEQTPEITIRGGEAQLTVPQPHLIRDPDSGQTWVVLDTTGAVTDLAGQEAAVLLTRRELLVRTGAARTHAIRLSDVPDFTVTRDRLRAWGQSLTRWMAPTAYPFVVAGAFAGRALQALVYAAMGGIMAMNLKLSLPFTALLRLTVVAMTPAILIETGLSLAGFATSHAPLWESFLTLCYVFLGLRAGAQPRQATPAESP